jgi:hypothetical protein
MYNLKNVTIYPSLKSWNNSPTFVYLSLGSFHICSLLLYVLDSGIIHFRYLQVQMGLNVQRDLELTEHEYVITFHQEFVYVSTLSQHSCFLVQLNYVWWVHVPSCNQSERKWKQTHITLKQICFILLLGCVHDFVHCSLMLISILNSSIQSIPWQAIKCIRADNAACKLEASFIFNIYIPLYSSVEILPYDGHNGWNMWHNYIKPGCFHNKPTVVFDCNFLTTV